MKISVNKLVENKGQIDGVPKNPRFIKDERYEDLKRSIQEDPEFLVLNPILVYDNGDETYTVVGGNMRYRAIKELGFKEVEVPGVIANGTDPKIIKSRIIKHNNTYGQDDWDLLGNEWDDEPLADWGLERADSFAPTLNPNSELMNTTDDDIAKEEAKLIRKVRGDNKEQLSVMCPYCAEEFYVNED